MPTWRVFQKSRSKIVLSLNPENISIVIPAYGACAELPEVLAALLNQTRMAGEIIVAHSGEHDPTDELQKLDVRVRVVHSDESLLAGAARNLGVEHCLGEWIAFVDADTVPGRDWLEELVACAQDARTDFVVGAIGCANPGGYWGRCNVKSISLFLSRFMYFCWVLQYIAQRFFLNDRKPLG